jgi:hypothetical protein
MIKATLVNGKDYYLSDKEGLTTKHFVEGVALEVTAKEKAHLIEHAKDPVALVSGKTSKQQWQQKFEFETVEDEGRTRARKPAKDEPEAEAAA